MPIVTIARERGARGEQNARKLAKELNCRLIDKAYLEEKLLALGLSQKSLASYDEKKPGFFAALSNVMEDYVRCLKKVVYEETAEGNCVFLGRGTQFLLKDFPNVARVRLVAPMEVRIQRLMEHYGISEAQAERELRTADNDRREFNNHFFEADWSEASCYHLVLNSALLSDDQICDNVKQLALSLNTQENELACQKRAKMMARAQELERMLLHEGKLPIFFLEIHFEGDTAVLEGITNLAETVTKAEELLKAQGVSQVKNNLRMERTGSHCYMR